MATSPTELTLRHLRADGWTAEVVERHGRILVNSNGCWIWQGARDTSTGYGRVSKSYYGEQWAHRLFYRELVGPIPADLVIDHLCRVRECVNPAHMEPVTRRENARRSPLMGIAYRHRSTATHCLNGHERTIENIYVAPNGHSRCRVCQMERQRIARAK